MKKKQNVKTKKPMLSKLFGSNARVKLLKLFLLNPEKKYYIRQIARDLKIQLNSVRRELENLEEFGLLISTPADLNRASEGEKEGEKINNAKKPFASDKINKQEKKFYKVNKDFILFDELKVLITKAQILYEKDFVIKIQKAGRPRVLILTGVFVNNPNSIVDILAVGKFDRQKFIKIIKQLEEEMGREINFTIMDSKEFKYRRDITDVFLYSVLEGRKFIVIDDLGAC